MTLLDAHLGLIAVKTSLVVIRDNAGDYTARTLRQSIDEIMEAVSRAAEAIKAEMEGRR